MDTQQGWFGARSEPGRTLGLAPHCSIDAESGAGGAAVGPVSGQFAERLATPVPCLPRCQQPMDRGHVCVLACLLDLHTALAARRAPAARSGARTCGPRGWRGVHASSHHPPARHAEADAISSRRDNKWEQVARPKRQMHGLVHALARASLSWTLWPSRIYLSLSAAASSPHAHTRFWEPLQLEDDASASLRLILTVAHRTNFCNTPRCCFTTSPVKR